MSFGAAPTFLQGAGDVELRRLERRDDAKKNPGERGDAESERQDTIIDPDLAEPRCAFGNDRHKQIGKPDAEEQSRSSTDHRKQNALRQNLPPDATAAGA